MLEPPIIVETDEHAAAVIHHTIPRFRIREVMGPAIVELHETLARQGIQELGPVFAHHYKLDPKIFDFDVGIPVLRPVTPSRAVMQGRLPATRVARTVYRGPYEGLPDAWREFEAWVKAQGLKPGRSLWESYITGPESGSHPDKWITELNRPLLP